MSILNLIKNKCLIQNMEMYEFLFCNLNRNDGLTFFTVPFMNIILSF